jgi:hypothetical protein
MTLCCPQCRQPVAPTGLRLPRIKQRILESVRRRPGITVQELLDQVWADALDGGPLTGAKCLHVHVAQLNRRLAPHGLTVRALDGGYQLREQRTVPPPKKTTWSARLKFYF